MAISVEEQHYSPAAQRAGFEINSRLIAALLNEGLLQAYPDAHPVLGEEQYGIKVTSKDDSEHSALWIATAKLRRSHGVWHNADFNPQLLIRGRHQDTWSLESDPLAVAAVARDAFVNVVGGEEWRDILVQLDSTFHNMSKSLNPVVLAVLTSCSGMDPMGHQQAHPDLGFPSDRVGACCGYWTSSSSSAYFTTSHRMKAYSQSAYRWVGLCLLKMACNPFLLPKRHHSCSPASALLRFLAPIPE